MTSTKAVLLFATYALAKARLPKKPEDLTTPVQQRIAVYGPNAISIGWNTYEHLDKPCVQWGLTNSSLINQTCSNVSLTYPTSRTWSNTVVLTDLKPATTYYYKIQSKNTTVSHFCSPRLAGDKTPFSMNTVVDMGVYGADGFTIKGDHSKRDLIPYVSPSLNHTTIDRLAKTADDYEFIIHPGDLAYADDWNVKKWNLDDEKDAYQAILEQFYEQLAPVSRRKPYMASPGNHELGCGGKPAADHVCPSGQSNFTDFGNRFGNVMPFAFASTSSSDTAKINANKANELARPPFWYSFEYGMAHVTMIDTETDFNRAPEADGHDAGPFGKENQQQDFLEADLASVDRSVTPWVVVAGHRPWYTTGGADCKSCRTAFEHILYKYGVDVAVFGHVHNTQRILPVYNNTLDPAGLNNPRAPVYLVTGAAGNIEGLSKIGKKEPWLAYGNDNDFAYGQLQFKDANHLGVHMIRSSDGKVIDSSTLYKKHDQKFVLQQGEAQDV